MIRIHKFVGLHIVIAATVHVAAHSIDYLQLSKAGSLDLDMGTPEQLWLTLLPSYTGHVAVVCLFLMLTSSLNIVRKANFEIFWYTHHLFIVFMAVLVNHGGACIIEQVAGKQCYLYAEFWKWVILSLLCYDLERIVCRALLRALKPIKIQKIIHHPSNVIEIRFIPSYINQMTEAKPGQYIYLNIPAVGGPKTKFGRPNWPSIFLDMLHSHHDHQPIGIFACGPKSLTTQIYKQTRLYPRNVLIINKEFKA